MDTSRWLAALAATLLLGIAANGEEFKCTNEGTDHCICSKTLGEYVLDCPRQPQEVSVIVTYKPRESVRIMCTSSTKEGHWPTTISYLNGLRLGKVKSFIINMCPGVPDMSFSELMETMGVTHVTSFHLNHMSISSNASNHLTREHLKAFENINHMDLSSNKLTYLPEDLFADSPNLTWLDLKNNRAILPKNIFRSVPKLEVLELGSNNLTFLEPGIFRNLTKLRLLNLWGNRLHNLTRNVFTDVVNLESLDINSNHMVSLVPDLFADLTNLKCLNLYNNDFSTLPRGLFLSNTKLEKIQIYHNRRNLRLPPGLLQNLKNLKEVKMSHCNLTELPEDLLYGSESITNITFKFNALTRIPEDLFRDAVKLQDLDLSHNKLVSIPDRLFSNLENLLILNLASNNITHIKELSLIGLTSLTDLHVEYNSLEHVHQSAFTFVKSLKKINLSHNKLKSLKLRQVQYGEFRDEETISVLHPTSLEVINLSYNNLSEIYDDWRVTKLNIKRIDLSYNSFTRVNFSDLIFSSFLPEMDLSNNQISVVDFDNAESLAKYYNRTINTSLKVLLNNNPIQCDCRANSLVKYLSLKMDPQVYYLVQVDPVGVKCSDSGMDLKRIDPRELICKKNNDGCPNYCKCFYRPYDTSMLIDCSGVGYTSPPDLNFLLTYMSNSFNQTIVDLSNNSIEVLPANFNFIGYNKTTFLNLSHNKLRNISAISLNPYLKELLLDFNNLTKLDNEMLNYLQKSQQLKKLTLTSNPWTCNCEAKNLLNFVQSNYAKVVIRNVTCSNGMNMANMTVTDLCPTSNLIIGLTSLIIALLGLVVGGLFAIYYRYQKEIKVWLYARNMCLWFVTEEEIDKDKQYDAFISFSQEDVEFVSKTLVPEMENKSPKYKVCIHYRDWVPGDFIPTQIIRSVQESKRTIIILSPAFIESIWGLMEFRTAHQQALKEGRSRIIIILYGDIGPTDKLDPELKAYLSTNTYVKWGDPWFWEKLRYALPHPSKNQSLPMTALPETKLLKNGSTPTINGNVIEASKPV